MGKSEVGRHIWGGDGRHLGGGGWRYTGCEGGMHIGCGGGRHPGGEDGRHIESGCGCGCGCWIVGGRYLHTPKAHITPHNGIIAMFGR
jgi:hypothetical protein